MIKRIILVLAMLSFFTLACAKYESKAPPPEGMDQIKKATATMLAEEEQSDDAPAPPAKDNRALQGRKLIREGTVSIRVSDLEKSRASLEQMVQKAEGFVANVTFNRYGASHRLTMVLRLPADGFGNFVKSLQKLGNIEKEQINVQDVTDHWVDLNRRIATKEMLADRLEALIKEKSYRFKDLLEVERELSRLHLEIEQLKGSLRGLDDRIALSTLTIEMNQAILQKVVPPDSVFAPLVNAFENAGPRMKNSIRAMSAFIAFFINLIIALIPWIVLAFLFIGTIWLVVKIRKRNKK